MDVQKFLSSFAGQGVDAQLSIIGNKLDAPRSEGEKGQAITLNPIGIPQWSTLNTQYLFVKYSQHYPTQDADVSDEPGPFVGIRYSVSPVESTIFTMYRWYNILGEIGNVGAKGETGDKGLVGDEGPRGVTGKPLKILGYVGTAAELGTVAPNPNDGDAYIVGNDIDIYDAEYLQWRNYGPIEGPEGMQGAKGDTGDQGPQGDQGAQGNPVSVTVSELANGVRISSGGIDTDIFNGLYSAVSGTKLIWIGSESEWVEPEEPDPPTPEEPDEPDPPTPEEPESYFGDPVTPTELDYIINYSPDAILYEPIDNGVYRMPDNFDDRLGVLLIGGGEDGSQSGVGGHGGKLYAVTLAKGFYNELSYRISNGEVTFGGYSNEDYDGVIREKGAVVKIGDSYYRFGAKGPDYSESSGNPNGIDAVQFGSGGGGCSLNATPGRGGWPCIMLFYGHSLYGIPEEPDEPDPPTPEEPDEPSDVETGIVSLGEVLMDHVATSEHEPVMQMYDTNVLTPINLSDGFPYEAGLYRFTENGVKQSMLQGEAFFIGAGSNSNGLTGGSGGKIRRASWLLHYNNPLRSQLLNPIYVGTPENPVTYWGQYSSNNGNVFASGMQIKDLYYGVKGKDGSYGTDGDNYGDGGNGGGGRGANGAVFCMPEAVANNYNSYVIVGPVDSGIHTIVIKDSSINRTEIGSGGVPISNYLNMVLVGADSTGAGAHAYSNYVIAVPSRVTGEYALRYLLGNSENPNTTLGFYRRPSAQSLNVEYHTFDSSSEETGIGSLSHLGWSAADGIIDVVTGKFYSGHNENGYIMLYSDFKVMDLPDGVDTVANQDKVISKTLIRHYPYMIYADYGYDYEFITRVSIDVSKIQGYISILVVEPGEAGSSSGAGGREGQVYCITSYLDQAYADSKLTLFVYEDRCEYSIISFEASDVYREHPILVGTTTVIPEKHRYSNGIVIKDGDSYSRIAYQGPIYDPNITIPVEQTGTRWGAGGRGGSTTRVPQAGGEGRIFVFNGVVLL